MEIYIHDKHILTRLLQVLLFLILPFTVFAQQDGGTPLINSRLEEGIVTDSVTKQPIAGVTLQIKGVTHAV